MMVQPWRGQGIVHQARAGHQVALAIQNINSFLLKAKWLVLLTINKTFK